MCFKISIPGIVDGDFLLWNLEFFWTTGFSWRPGAEGARAAPAAAAGGAAGGPPARRPALLAASGARLGPTRRRGGGGGGGCGGGGGGVGGVGVGVGGSGSSVRSRWVFIPCNGLLWNSVVVSQACTNIFYGGCQQMDKLELIFGKEQVSIRIPPLTAASLSWFGHGFFHPIERTAFNFEIVRFYSTQWNPPKKRRGTFFWYEPFWLVLLKKKPPSEYDYDYGYAAYGRGYPDPYYGGSGYYPYGGSDFYYDFPIRGGRGGRPSVSVSPLRSFAWNTSSRCGLLRLKDAHCTNQWIDIV